MTCGVGLASGGAEQPPATIFGFDATLLNSQINSMPNGIDYISFQNPKKQAVEVQEFDHRPHLQAAR
jgi:hypothetical protein